MARESRKVLQSGHASDLVQRRVRDAMCVQRDVQQLDTEPKLLDGGDAAELLGSVVLVHE
jgi:hypothetical protein